MAKTVTTLRAVMYKDGEQWVAVCLEHCILAIGKDPSDVLANLRQAVVGSLEISEEMGVEPFEGIPRTPQRYWDLYEKSHPLSLADWVEAPTTSLPAIELRTAARELAA